MIGEIRYWCEGDAAVLCLSESEELVTLAYWGCDGIPLGTHLHSRRVWDRFTKVTA